MIDPTVLNEPEAMVFTSGPICLDEFVSVLGQYSNNRWNGWLCPSIDALAVMEVAEVFKDDETLVLNFEGDPGAGTGVLIRIDIDGDEWYEERIEPDEDGLYSLGAYSWTWSEDRLYYCTDEYKAWVSERTDIWCAASNANNQRLHDEGVELHVFDRLRLNDAAAEAAAAEWEKSHPAPPKEQA